MQSTSSAAMTGGAFANDVADVSEDFSGGALWLPPGVLRRFLGDHDWPLLGDP